MSRVKRMSRPIDPVGHPFVTAAHYITNVGVIDVCIAICIHMIIHDTVMIMLSATLQNLLKDDRRRWAVLVVVCFGQFMIVLDTTIVNVALPAIQSDLGFSQSSLTWVVNAYLIAFGAFLLPAGRLSDLLGSRRVFLTGLTVFTLASIACGLAASPIELIAFRFVQGFGGALTAAVARVESRSDHPLVPPTILRVRSLMYSSVVRGAIVTGMFGAFFLGSLYLERVRGFDAVQIGLAFLPMPIGIGTMSIGVTG